MQGWGKGGPGWLGGRESGLGEQAGRGRSGAGDEDSEAVKPGGQEGALRGVWGARMVGKIVTGCRGGVCDGLQGGGFGWASGRDSRVMP